MTNAIDVSKHQGIINWDNIQSAGITQVMIRAGYGRFDHQRDPQFERNYKEATARGIEVGVYWYSYATTADQARQEARCCLRAIADKQITLPAAYDIEYEPGILALSTAARTELVKAFLGEIEAAGYYGILYASTDYIRNRLTYKALTQYDVWAAQYGSKCTCPLPYGIWQYSSTNALGVPGFGSHLDCNRVYKDYPTIIAGASLNKLAPEEPDDTDTTPDLSAKLQQLSIDASNGDALAIKRTCKGLGLIDMGLYKDTQTSDTMQHMEIGPVSSGDAWMIMRRCEGLGLCDMGYYKSKYVEA